MAGYRAILIACAFISACIDAIPPPKTTRPPVRPAPSATSSARVAPSAEPIPVDRDDDLPPRPTMTELLGEERDALRSVDVAAAVAAAKSAGIGARPAHCAEWVNRARRSGNYSLATALAQTRSATRDAMLMTHSEIGVARLAALRADFAPIECADALTDPPLRELAADRAVLAKDIDTLVGLSVASKLARATSLPAIDALKTAFSGLRGYGWALALVESAIADVRVGGSARKYLARDALLTAFRELATVGVLRNARVAKARSLVSNEFPDQRLDALDELLLPSWSPPDPDTDAERALANTPAHWHRSIADAFATHRWWLPALASGVSQRDCYALSCMHYTRGRIDLGRLYWRKLDFLEAAHTARLFPTGDPELAHFYGALARDLLKGPDDATDRMGPDGGAAGLHETPALDAFAKENWSLSGIAAFDAAHLRSLAVPEGEPRIAYLADLRKRFEASAELLRDPALKKRALERAAKVR